MPTLNIGVVDVPYENAGSDAVAGAKRKRGDGSVKGAPVTTAEVAQYLEEKYGVMQAFYTAHEDEIKAAMISSAEGALEDLYAGAPMSSNPFSGADNEIAAMFKQFLLTGEIENMGIEGVPTQASIDRKSLRFKNKKSSEPRPSFIDSSLYELSSRAWTE